MNIKDLKKCYLGDKEIGKILLGNEVIWEEYKKKWVIDESLINGKETVDEKGWGDFKDYLPYIGIIRDDNYKIENYGIMNVEEFMTAFDNHLIFFIFTGDINALQSALDKFRVGTKDFYSYEVDVFFNFGLKINKNEFISFDSLKRGLIKYE